MEDIYYINIKGINNILYTDNNCKKCFNLKYGYNINKFYKLNDKEKKTLDKNSLILKFKCICHLTMRKS